MHNFIITKSAAERIKALQSLENNQNLKLRIAVDGGGCSGFKYQYSLDEKVAATDLVFTQEGIEVLIDDISIGFLHNATLDYTEDLGSAGFEIKNPNSTAKCGCGNSFSI